MNKDDDTMTMELDDEGLAAAGAAGNPEDAGAADDAAGAGAEDTGVETDEEGNPVNPDPQSAADEESGEESDPEWNAYLDSLPPKARAGAQKSIDKRIGKSVAKERAAEARAEAAEAKLAELEAERMSEEDRKYVAYGVDPDYFDEADRRELDSAAEARDEAEAQAASWDAAEAGTVVNGRELTEADIRRQATLWSRRAGEAQGRITLVTDRAKRKMADDLREVRRAKNGKAVLGAKAADSAHRADTTLKAAPPPAARRRAPVVSSSGVRDNNTREIKKPIEIPKSSDAARAAMDGMDDFD